MSEPKTMIMIGSAWPLRGGLANFNERLVKEFQSQGWNCEIYTFSLQYPSILFPGKSQYSDEPAPENLKIHINVNSINPFNWIRIGLAVKRKKPDLVVMKFWIPFMAPCLGTIARIIRSNKKTKVITVIDNIIPHEKRPGDRLLASYFAKSVDGYITMSESVLNDLTLFNTTKPRELCLHPIYDNFGPAIPKQKALQTLKLDPAFHYILFFGFIRDYKGLDLLLMAMADDRIRQLPVKLMIAGEYYTNSEPYLKLISDLNLHERVLEFTDFIPDSEVKTYFSACDVVVQPYKSATQSGVTQIAYHFEKPIITTNVGGLAEIVPDNKVGFVVEPDSLSIADAIVRFYTENLESKFVLGVQEEKARFSWKNMTDSIQRLK